MLRFESSKSAVVTLAQGKLILTTRSGHATMPASDYPGTEAARSISKLAATIVRFAAKKGLVKSRYSSKASRRVSWKPSKTLSRTAIVCRTSTKIGKWSYLG